MNQKIVICDDEQEILDITQMILEDEGFEVIAVIDSTLVEDIIERERPDLLLIDLWMPRLAGNEVISALRKNATIQEIPVIVISASRDGKQIAYASGADDFLEKPYDIDALVEVVRKRIA